MRQLTLSASEALDDDGDRSRRSITESEYVSLSELRSSSSLSLLVPSTSDTVDTLVPLTVAAEYQLRRAQDALLVVVIILCVVLVCWACTQVYQGQLCNDTSGVCTIPTLSRRFVYRGGPDLVLDHDTFEGGWPLSHSLLHVFLPTAVVLYVLAAKLHAPVVYNAIAWVWFTLVQLSIVALDAYRLRRWQGPTCALLQVAMASLRPQDTMHCVTRAYDAFVALEMLLVVVMTLVMILEPVLFRLWWGIGSGQEPIDHDLEDKPLLQQEDVPSPHETFRRL